MMHRLNSMRPTLGTIGLVMLVVGNSIADEQHWTFEKLQAGAMPEGWHAAKTGEGPGSEWQIVADASAPSGICAFAQLSLQGPQPLFNVCTVERNEYKNLDLSVAFKAVTGKIDQGGGPVWRYIDENNYYIARLNPLENNYRVYKVVDGKRTELASAETDAAAGVWHKLRIVQRDDQIVCYLGDKELLSVRDDTFREAGRIGLWTKADAITFFDELAVKELE